MRKFFSKIHLWLSIPLGLLITLICLTGAILVFRTEIEEIAYSDLLFISEEYQSEKLSVAELVPLVNSQLENDSITGISVFAEPGRNYSAPLASNPRSSVYVNPYTGEVLGKMDGGFFSKMMQLHRWLLIKREIGKPIVGYATLLMVIIIIAGVIMSFPKNRKQLKQIFTINFTKGWKRFWRDLHVSGGMYTLIGLLVLALTGLTWSFQWYREPFYKLFGADITQNVPHGTQQGRQQPQSGSPENERGKQHPDAQAKQKPGKRQDSLPTQDTLQLNIQQPAEQPGNTRQGKEGGGQRRQEALNVVHWDEVLAYIQIENPNYKRITVQNGSATVTQNKTFGNSRATDRYTFDVRTGEITEYTPYEKQDRSIKVRGWIYSIHVGSWGGWLSKIITFIIALVGASLPITGYYLWLKKMKRKKSKAQE